jgi:hypothetical protein
MAGFAPVADTDGQPGNALPEGGFLAYAVAVSRISAA